MKNEGKKVMKYKVGDTVRIRKDLIEYQNYGGRCLVSSMLRFRGETMTVREVNKNSNFYKLKGSNGFWTDDMFVDSEKKITAAELEEKAAETAEEIKSYKEERVVVAELGEPATETYKPSDLTEALSDPAKKLHSQPLFLKMRLQKKLQLHRKDLMVIR